MVTSLKNIKGQVDSRLAGGGLTDLACCQLQNAQFILDNNVVTSVPDLASLPDAALNEGRLLYANDINEYRFSNGEFWSDDVASTVEVYSNQLWTWGSNFCGALGDGTVTNRCSPVREFCSATDWCQVSSDCAHTAAIKISGQLWAWGCGSAGRLGNGGETSHCSPVREFCSATDWCQVSAGCLHTAAIKTSGELWAWGGGSAGRLGDGTVTNRCSPVREYCSATDWCQVSAGSNHTAAIKTSGQLWAWGYNSCGQLGDGTLTNRCSPVREFCSATDWCQVSTNSSTIGTRLFTSAVKTSGELWSWGSNGYGQLGDGTVTTRCSPIREFCSATDWCGVTTGGLFTGAIKTSGQIWTWGTNNSNRLGDGTSVTKCSPVREFCSATDWCAISTTYSFVAAIKTSGELWSWGSNSCGQLGDGTVTNRCSPVREFCSATDWCQVSAGATHAAAIKAVIKGFLE